VIPEEEIRRRGAEPVSLAELYAQSDFITLHIRLARYQGLINQQA